MATQRDIDAGRLYDLLAEGDLTRDQITSRTGWGTTRFGNALRKLRDILGDSDTINVTYEPHESGRRHLQGLYGLKAGNIIIDAAGSRWLPHNLAYLERFVQTIIQMLRTTVAATDGRTVLGRKARVYLRYLTRAQEDVAMIEEGP